MIVNKLKSLEIKSHNLKQITQLTNDTFTKPIIKKSKS
jgi:hypothetical protein